ncbi:Glutathione S-transferase 2 [Steccherinum ochraceum]|uniref:glutathione transferase n=1 Tax=Steccherinum ochraceum TaxID=92696 RepID=A0A4R0RZL8_9APHY|nr:Glutathione S-transferase 2 [Steccherinum ochraceum]
MSHSKQFTLFSHKTGPNGWKVVFVLNTLGLEYETVYLNFEEVKQPAHTQYNPNGRIPTLIDHANGDLVIWESCAIILYLIERYDPEHKISVSDPNEKTQLVQWLFFQASGQGPYFGQVAYFKKLHPEKLPSVIVRYQDETRRILGVLESVLKQRPFLVGGKMTAADISFAIYNNLLYGKILDEGFNFEKEFPCTFVWHQKIIALEGVKAGLSERQRMVEEEEKNLIAASSA